MGNTGLQIAIQNHSSHDWVRNNWGVGAGSQEGLNWTDEITQTPSESLRKNNGTTSTAVDQSWFKWLAEDALWIQLGYGCQEGDFAVRLEQQFHLATIGPRSRWCVWSQDKKWTTPTDDTTPYTWTFNTCTVIATPTIVDDAVSVSVLIRPKM